MTSETAFLWSTIYHNKNNNFWKKGCSICIQFWMAIGCEGEGKMFYEGLILTLFEYHWTHLYFLYLRLPPCTFPSHLYNYIYTPIYSTCIKALRPDTYQLPYLNLSVCGTWSMEKGEWHLIPDWVRLTGGLYFTTWTVHIHILMRTNMHALWALSSLRLTVKGDIKMRRWWIYWRSALSPILFPSLLTEHRTGW